MVHGNLDDRRVRTPTAHWVSGRRLARRRGILDFSGGTVVHINAGAAALAACIVLGPRTGYPDAPMPPNNLGYTVVGAAMLWVGWFGFNAGSAMAADGVAGMAMMVTQLAAARRLSPGCSASGSPTASRACSASHSGAVAGLVAVTPASGSVGPMGAIVIGISSGLLCFFAATRLKSALGYDDSLDVFGIHCIGGNRGRPAHRRLLRRSAGGCGIRCRQLNIASQLMSQLTGIGVTLVYSFVVSFVVLKILDAAIGLRVSAEDEEEGLDLALHDERSYIL